MAIVGPTAVGKSKLGIKMAKLFNGEIISGDSVQVYRELNIGSAKVSAEEQNAATHHLINILSYQEKYSVYEFQKRGRALISEITEREHLPIVVGGTGLYIKALLYDYNFNSDTITDNDYQKYSSEELWNLLNSKDPVAASKVHVNNRKRIIRNLTLIENLPTNKTDFLAQQKQEPIYDIFVIGLTMVREKLYQAINQRVLVMIEEGLEEEIKNLYQDKELFNYQALQAIGYKEFRGYFEENMPLADVVNQIQTNTRRFAKRQYTWFNNQLNVQWYDIDTKGYQDAIANDIIKWLKK